VHAACIHQLNEPDHVTRTRVAVRGKAAKRTRLGVQLQGRSFIIVERA